MDDFSGDSLIVNSALEEHGGLRAYTRVRDQIRAVPKDAILTLNLEISHVVSRTLAVSSLVRPLRDEAALLPAFDVTCFDLLPQYARALFYVHTTCLGRAARKADVRPIVARAVETRERMLSDLQVVLKRRQLDAAPHHDFSGNRSYLELVEDLLVLEITFRDNWHKLEGRTALNLSELDAASSLACELMYAVSDRERPRREESDRARERAQAFTLLVRTYEEVRRAVSFLRWRQRDELVPSLYSGRFKTRRKAKDKIAEVEAQAIAETALAEPSGGR